MVTENALKPSDWPSQAEAILDQATTLWHQMGPEHALLTLNVQLNQLRHAAGDTWIREVVPAVRRHPITQTIRAHSPIAGHAASWPRGYPGDAGLIDLFYEANAVSASLADEQRRANATIRQSQSARSVRMRRLVIADAIDECASRNPQAEILSVACGHVREVEWSLAMSDGLVSRFVAADQDEASLAEVERRLSHRFPMVQPLRLSVRGIIAGRAASLGQFHFVYAAGLYDYLPENVGRALTARLFSLLRPNGRLLIGNFSQAPQDIGFMESIMDWSLIWRSEGELARLADAIPSADIARQSVWADATGACIYLDLVRA
ncbi:MAG: class I SAM-dependent methyltransferase [Sphingopyxis sp.]|jgi:hypothetical protein|nr:class I SAM-dependent methyltransferase [Sphingopyxis sp.]